MGTSGADHRAYGGLRTGPPGLEVGGSAFGLEAIPSGIATLKDRHAFSVT